MSRDESWDGLDRDQRRARRRQFRKRKERKLDERRDRLDSLEFDDEAQADLHAKVEGVRQSKRRLRGRLQDLRHASDHEWDDVRDDFDDSWREFENDWEDLSELVKGRRDNSEDEF